VTFLADKSAWARMAVPAVRERLVRLVEDDLIVTCGIIDIEILSSARNRKDFDELHRAQRGFRRASVDDRVFDEAIAIQGALAVKGQHRRPIPDLLIAATALVADLTVLHYDHDFDIIATVRTLRHEWIVPRGSIA
jgi:predicted nucleic acid-binding protein